MSFKCSEAFIDGIGIARVKRRNRSPLRREVCSCQTKFEQSPSKISEIKFRNRRVFVKRDDQLFENGVSGNKVRKFASLNAPGALSDVDAIVSYGGAQSNAMLALATLSKRSSIPFVYVTRQVPQQIDSVSGNFQSAIRTGMVHVQLQAAMFKETFLQSVPLDAAPAARRIARNALGIADQANILFVPQGAAWPGAERGVKQLADELRVQIGALRDSRLLTLRRPIIFLSAGTGTTAFFLAQHLSDIAKIVTVPVSGDERYLIKQMRWLHAASRTDSTNLRSPIFPDVLCPRVRSSFADVRADKFRIWQEMERATQGMFGFDLVYAPKTWEEVFLAIDEKRLNVDGKDLFYYHSGGLEGNTSMLDRFRRKGFVLGKP